MFVNGEQYYGAKANINVWAPHVSDQYEFSLSQIWVISGSFNNDLNTIEAGWQACFYYSLFLFSSFNLHPLFPIKKLCIRLFVLKISVNFVYDDLFRLVLSYMEIIILDSSHIGQ